MNKTLLSAVAGFFACALSLQGQGMRSDGLRSADWESDVSFVSLALGERTLVSYPAAFGWLNPGSDFLPAFHPVEPRRSRAANSYRAASIENQSSDWLDGRRLSRFDFGGEVGFVYGRETGRGGGDFYSGYIVGEMGNEHFRLSVGASYSEFDGRGTRRRR